MTRSRLPARRRLLARAVAAGLVLLVASACQAETGQATPTPTPDRTGIQTPLPTPTAVSVKLPNPTYYLP